MPTSDSFPKMRRLIMKMLKEGLSRFGFTQHETSAYFVRDRGPIRDGLFFQKMRSNAVTITYGMGRPPQQGEWSPGLMPARRLAEGCFYNVKYEEHVRSSIAQAISDFESEALPWFEQFATEADIERYGPRRCT